MTSAALHGNLAKDGPQYQEAADASHCGRGSQLNHSSRQRITEMNKDISMQPQQIIASTTAWMERAVIGLNLCPFAKSVHAKRAIRYMVSEAKTADALVKDLLDELQLLQSSDPQSIATTLLIHPFVLNDFLDYNDFLDVADAIVRALNLEGIIQIASFHPQYQFAGAGADDIENYTNRSPYPTLHLLREASIEEAVRAFPDASEIFGKNMETLRKLGHAGWEEFMGQTLSPDAVSEDKKKY